MALYLLQTIFLQQLSGKQRFGQHGGGFARGLHQWDARRCVFSFVMLTASATAILSLNEYGNCTGVLTTISDAVCDIDNNVEVRW